MSTTTSTTTSTPTDYTVCRLTSLPRFKQALQLEGIEGQRELEVGALEIWNGNPNVLYASVAITKDSIILSSEAGTTTSEAATTTTSEAATTSSSTTSTPTSTSSSTTTSSPTTTSTSLSTTTTTLPAGPEFFFSDFNALGGLIRAIEASGDWVVLNYVDPETDPSTLIYTPETECSDYNSRATLVIRSDSWLERLLDSVSDFISYYCRRDFCFGERREWIDVLQPEVDVIHVRNYPVHGSVVIKENGTTLVENEDFKLDRKSGLLTRLNGYWAEGTKIIYARYSAGYISIPEELQSLTCEVGRVYYYKSGRDPLLTLEKIGTYRMEVVETFLGEDILGRLATEWMRWD